MGDGIVIDESMFEPKVLGANNQIVVTDYKTFERRVTTLADEGVDTLRIQYQDLVFKFWVGKTLEEKPFDLVDNNLNGIIDENNGAVVGEGADAFTSYLYVGLKAVDYFSGAGVNNILLDERRDDGIDNDGDWDIAFDDVGADGVPRTGDSGEGDGIPTNGEPHFDKVDIDETDMIGLTSMTLYLWPDIPHYDDEKVWQNTLPGFFDEQLLNENIELLYGSGYFPLKAGTTERFSMGIICGISEDDYLENVGWFAKAYNENYNFSKAPLTPTVKAIPGDRKVTLVWDSLAEESEDPITGKDFEGYKIYRSTDPGWNDAQPITDGQGVTTYRKPIAQFDLDNEYSGFAPIAVKGIKFQLGDNTGIVNSWTDTTAVNGQTYFYAVTSYDHGSAEGGIAPTECSKFITLNTAGEVEDKGSNVVIAIPEAPSNGFVPAGLSDAVPIQGGDAQGQIGYKIVNPLDIVDGGLYQVSFEDTLVQSSTSTAMTLATKNITLVNVSAAGLPDTLLNHATEVQTGGVLPVTDGFQLKLVNLPEMALNADSSMWSNDSIYSFVFAPFRCSKTNGRPMANDYLVEFGEVGMDTSLEVQISKTRKVDPTPVNFRITNTTQNKRVAFGFWENDVVGEDAGMFTGFTKRSRTDEIIFLEPDENDSLVITWSLKLNTVERLDTTKINPKAGDNLVIKMDKPFLSGDVYTFTTAAQSVDMSAVDLDLIKVVPNPYVVSNSWEPLNPYTNGRGPRELHFTHLPPACSIKIFNIRGQLVRELEHDAGGDVLNGTLVWDMLTKDKLDISYGVYVYYINAGENGEKVGKFAVIK